MISLPGRDAPVSDHSYNMLYIDPEGRSEEENKMLARRKAFSIIHQVAPDVTRIPEMARDIIDLNLEGASSVAGMVNDTSKVQGQYLDVRRARTDEDKANAAQWGNAISAIQGLSDYANQEVDRRNSDEDRERAISEAEFNRNLKDIQEGRAVQDFDNKLEDRERNNKYQNEDRNLASFLRSSVGVQDTEYNRQLANMLAREDATEDFMGLRPNAKHVGQQGPPQGSAGFSQQKNP